MTDIEINQKAKLKPINTLLKKHGFKKEDLINYGDFKGKLNPQRKKRKAELILVTSINPTAAGEGKTTMSIGLHEAMNKMKLNSLIALREPSLGPVFGVKGGAAGGGYAQIAPIEDINLHFNGDFHAITSANNLIAAAIDNHIYWGNALNIKEVSFKRCLDVNDRSLRNINYEIKKGEFHQSHFQITAASELMAIFTLAKDLKELKEMVDKIVIGFDNKNKPVYVKSLNVSGSVVALLKDAIIPNVVQTLEGNLALVHGGPFANVAHGCNSIIATEIALENADYVITEAGFGADLGAEKFLNIKCRKANIKPSVAVVVETIKALKMQGGVAKEDLAKENVAALEKGVEILEKHISIIKGFNVNCVVAINNHVADHKSERQFIEKWLIDNKVPFAYSDAWEMGGKGSMELAKVVLKNMKKRKVEYSYDVNDSIENKINDIAKKVYGANKVVLSETAKKKIKLLTKNKLDKNFICMAKTPSSITDNPKVLGIPKKWTLKVTDISLSNGAGLIVVKCGNIFTMPGLGRVSQFTKINYKNNKIIGLD